MNYSAVFLSKARQELADAWEWYEDRQRGLGDRFELYVFRKVNIILKTPNITSVNMINIGKLN